MPPSRPTGPSGSGRRTHRSRPARASTLPPPGTRRGGPPPPPTNPRAPTPPPPPLSTPPAGRTAIGGVAWAQHRGVGQVEVKIDDGPWQQTRLGPNVGIDYWRQWYLPWDA